MVLHAYEPGPALLRGARLHRGELKRPHARRADVAHFPARDQVVQSGEGLFDGRLVVEAVDLQEVDVVGFEAGEGTIHGVEDRFAGKAWA